MVSVVAMAPLGPAAGSFGVLFAALNLLGMWHGVDAGEGDAKTKFLLVQSNIGNQEKIKATAGIAPRDAIINQLNGLTRDGLKTFGPVDFVIWPETAFPAIIDTSNLEGAYPQELRNFVSSIRTPLITGGFSRLPSNGKETNALFVIGANGKWMTEPYNKSVLLAFGEYTPMEEWFPSLHRVIPQMGHDMGSGPGPTVLDAGTVRLGPQICYEGLLDWYSRMSAKRGAQIIVNVTNDSWFGNWEKPFQSEMQTLARAIEVRRPLVRVTNTGLSTVMLASGQLMAVSPLSQAWIHLYEVPYATKPGTTLFMTWGYYLIPATLVAALMLISLGGRGRRDALSATAGGSTDGRVC
jgi:apolipoprotein N-acyltransferase